MERWEIIERYILLAVGAVLLVLVGWLAFGCSGIERFLFIALLMPCVYWVFWQALYEDKLQPDEPPSAGERFMYAIWLWSRRLVLTGISALLAFAAVVVIQKGSSLHDYGVVALLLFLSFMAGWVAVFGSGRQKSMSDDRAVHRERRKRYE
jgi:hypothetical protein